MKPKVGFKLCRRSCWKLLRARFDFDSLQSRAKSQPISNRLGGDDSVMRGQTQVYNEGKVFLRVYPRILTERSPSPVFPARRSFTHRMRSSFDFEHTVRPQETEEQDSEFAKSRATFQRVSFPLFLSSLSFLLPNSHSLKQGCPNLLNRTRSL